MEFRWEVKNETYGNYSSEHFLKEFTPIMQEFAKETNEGLVNFLEKHLPNT